MKQLFGLCFRWIMPTLGRWISKDSQAYSYLPESVAIFPEGQAFVDILRDAGYVSIRTLPLTGGIATIYLAQVPAGS